MVCTVYMPTLSVAPPPAVVVTADGMSIFERALRSKVLSKVGKYSIK